MPRLFRRTIKQVGSSPGTLVHVGEKKVEQTRIRVIDYDEKAFEERELDTIEKCFPYKDKASVSWINIDGLHDVDLIERLGQHFDLHPLVMEDILHTDQRPKAEDYEDYLFMVSKMLSYDEGKDLVAGEQFSLILGANFVITFQERVGDVFELVRERLRKAKGRIRKMGPDYLAYALMDAVVDHYLVVLERMGERVESLEDELVSDPTRDTLQAIHHMKRELIILRKSVWPLREVIGSLVREETGLIQEQTRVFLRDVYDHTIQVIDTTETFRDMVGGMLDIYLSSVSNRMNEVMKVLTIMATIFIPLTFIAGVYGMNFKFMPELEWHWGYLFVWFLMIGIAASMVLFFRKKGWL